MTSTRITIQETPDRKFYPGGVFSVAALSAPFPRKNSKPTMKLDGKKVVDMILNICALLIHILYFFL